MIEIRLSATDLCNIPVSRHQSFGEAVEIHVMARLREAGAPVEGFLRPKLPNGKLERFEDFEKNVLVIRWTP